MKKWLTILLFLVLPCCAIFAQQGNTVLVGSGLILQFDGDSLRIDTLRSFQYGRANSYFLGGNHLTDCQGSTIGFHHRSLRDDSLLIIKYTDRHYDEIYSQCGTGRFGDYSEFISPLEFDKTIFITADRTYGGNQWTHEYTFLYNKRFLRNDSMLWDTISCTGISDTFFTSRIDSESIRLENAIWHVTAHRGNSIFAFHIDREGIKTLKRSLKKPTTLSNSGSSIFPNVLKASNDGNHLALVEDNGLYTFSLYDFDKNTGAATYSKPLLTKAQLPSYSWCLDTYGAILPAIDGIAFSPNDSLIYVAYNYWPFCTDGSKMVRIIYQIDRYHPNPPSTANVVYSKFYNNIQSRQRHTMMFTAPNGIIYWGQPCDSAIHSISQANTYRGAIHHLNTISVSGHYNATSLDLSTSAYLRADFDIWASCEDSATAIFYGNEFLPKVTYHWGDGDSTVYDSGSLTNKQYIKHRYDSTGTYTVIQKALLNTCDYAQTKTKVVDVTIPPQSTAFSLSVDTGCTHSTLTITDTVSHTDSIYVDWGDGTTDTIRTGHTRITAVIISHSYTTSDTFDIAYRLIGHGIPQKNKSGCRYSADTSIHVVLRPRPTPQYRYTTTGTSTPIALQDTTLACSGEPLIVSQQNDSLVSFLGTLANDTVYADTDSIIYTLKGGWYTTVLAATTAHGCTVQDTIEIGIAQTTQVTWSTDSVFCKNRPAATQVNVVKGLGSLDQINSNLLYTRHGDTSLTLFHPAATSGEYIAQVVIHTDVGCRDTFSKKMRVSEFPDISIKGDSVGCINHRIEFDPKTESDDSIAIQWYVNSLLARRTDFRISGTHMPYELVPSVAGTSTIVAEVSTPFGCISTDTLQVAIIPPPQVILGKADDTLCHNQQPYHLTANLTLSNHSKVYTFWGDNLQDSNTAERNIDTILQHTYTSSGSYTLQSILAYNYPVCADTATSKVTILAPPSVTLQALDLCTNEKGEARLHWQSDTPLSWLKVYNNNTQIETYSELPKSGSITQEYLAGLQTNILLARARDTLGCTASSTQQYRTVEKPVATFDAAYLRTDDLAVTYMFTDKSQNHSTALLIYGDGISETLVPFFEQRHTYTDTGGYTATLVVSNENICADTAQLTVWAQPSITFYVPTSITPNGDQLNDYLHFDTRLVKALNVRIYNRWGAKVMTITNPEQLEKTRELPASVYLVRFSITDIYGKTHRGQQTLTVLR